MSKPHPDFGAILATVQSLFAHQSKFSGHGFRCVETSFAHDLLSGKGSLLHGGRWNAPGSFPAVYLADSPETALNEFLVRARRMHIRDYKALPMVMVAVKVKLSCLLDLRAVGVSFALDRFLCSEKIGWQSIQNRREAVSQAIGRAALTAGFKGLRAPSRQTPKAVNFVVFPDALSSGDRIAAPKFDKIKWK